VGGHHHPSGIAKFGSKLDNLIFKRLGRLKTSLANSLHFGGSDDTENQQSPGEVFNKDGIAKSTMIGEGAITNQ
jgi:hypothetical protein